MIALVIVSIIMCALSISVFIYYFVKFKKERTLLTLNKHYLTIFIGTIISFTIFSLLMGIGIKLANNFEMDNGHMVMLVFGSLLAGASFITLLETFTLYYYKPTLESALRKKIRILMFAMIPIFLIFFVLALESYAPYLTYPLISGFDLTNGNLLLGNESYGNFVIKWYGIIILIGALVVYFVCDHHFYQEYKKHGIIDTLFIVAFLMGILGARIWYCLVLDRSTNFIDFRSGGLAIMGGVILGALSGILFILFFRRYINLRHAMDMILPCVLIAQAIGRWGNFFNQEVYGGIVNEETLNWLPLFIRSNMFIDGAYRVPLFLIESFINISGYFIIMYGVKKGLNKHLSLGDLFCLYLVWYGLTRIILEPLRNGIFEYDNSLITAWIMFGGGLLAMVGLHLYDYFRWGKRTFILKDDSRLHNPKNPYFVKEEKLDEKH